MKTIRLSAAVRVVPCRWPCLAPDLLVPLAGFVQGESELLNRGDDDLVGVVVREQSSDESARVGVLLDAAFLELVELLAVCRSRSLRSTTNRHFSMSGLSFRSVDALKEVSVLPLPVVCQMYPLPQF